MSSIGSPISSGSSCCLGTIHAPHGIGGDVKVKSYTIKPEDLFAYGALYTDDGILCKLKLRRVIAPGMLIVSIEGVTTRNEAEAFKGKHLYIERTQLPPLSEASDEFYHYDLIDLEVKTAAGITLGQVREVANYGAGDLLEIITDKSTELMLPFTKEAVLEVNILGKFIVINPDHLLD